MEEATPTPADADDAIAVGAAEPLTDGIDDGKLCVDRRSRRGVLPAGLPDASQQRPQIVINLKLAQAVPGQRGADDNRNEAQSPPAAASGIRCRSSGSTIQPRQLAAPHRQGIAASAGQQ